MLLFSVSLQYFHADVFTSHELLTRKKPVVKKKKEKINQMRADVMRQHLLNIPPAKALLS